jgi:hypothetical protein
MFHKFKPLGSALTGLSLLAIIAAGPAASGPIGQALKAPGLSLLTLIEGAAPPVPMPADAASVDYDSDSGSLMFESATSVKELAQFYRDAMKTSGWSEQPSVINNDTMIVLDFSKGDANLNLTLMTMGDHTQVTGTGEGLSGAGDNSESADGSSGDGAAGGNTVLTFSDKDGLPSPNEATSSGSESSLFRRSVMATVEAKVPAVVEMYRKELAARGWTEATDKAQISDDSASLTFDTPNGPGFFTITRDGDNTNIQVGYSDKAAASQSPLFPKPGQVKIAIGNITDSAATVMIGGKTVKVKALAGSTAPDGPTLDVAPGTLKAEMEGGRAETIEAGPDQIWMIMVGPGGLLPIRAY